MYATFDMDFRSVTLDGYVDLAQLLRIVRIRDSVIPNHTGGLSLKQLVNSLNLMFELC